MGVVSQVAELMALEHSHKPLTGNCALFGRQTVSIPIPEIKKILEKYQISPKNIDFQNDKITRHRQSSITDRSFLSIFDIDNVRVVDISDYEGADLLADLNNPVDQNLHESFDLIYTGGCHDNVFNPAELLKNSARMLKPGGRVFHYEAFSGLIGAYTYLTPEWFCSYYAINNWRDCKIYVCHQKYTSNSRFHYKTDLYRYSHRFSKRNDFDYFDASLSISGIAYVMVVAEKDNSSTNDLVPIQSQYIEDGRYDWRELADKFDLSERPFIQGEKCQTACVSTMGFFHSDHYKHLGSL